MKLNFLCMPLLALLLVSCTFSETKKDGEIDPALKNQIHVLNKKIIEGLVQNNPELVLENCSDNLLRKKNDIKELMQVVKGNLKENQYKTLNEFYQKNASNKNIGVVSSGKASGHEYQIRYESLNKEMYVVVGYFGDKTDQKCFTFIYGKRGSIWKLNNIQAGILRIMNKDAIDWYQTAISDFQKGYYMDAVCHIGISTQLLNPLNHQWKYQKEKEIEAFEQEVTKKAYSTYHFPLTVGYVPTKPVIFRIHSQVVTEGYFPLILYTTTIDLNDIPALSKECDEIHKNIGKLFKGIDIDNTYILYSPVKTIPVGPNTTQQHGFIRKTR